MIDWFVFSCRVVGNHNEEGAMNREKELRNVDGSDKIKASPSRPSSMVMNRDLGVQPYRCFASRSFDTEKPAAECPSIQEEKCSSTPLHPTVLHRLGELSS
jgi:hypothetical protein